MMMLRWGVNLLLLLVPLIVAGIIFVCLPAMFSSRQEEGKTSAASAGTSSQEQDQQRQRQQQSGEEPRQITHLWC